MLLRRCVCNPHRIIAKVNVFALDLIFDIYERFGRSFVSIHKQPYGKVDVNCD